MPDVRKLTLRFEINFDGELSSSEFLSLFACIDQLSRAVMESETLRILDAFELPADRRLSSLRSILEHERHIPAPAEIQSIERGSWTVIAVITSPGLLWIIQKFVALPILEGWNDSSLRERLTTFFREHVFGGAKQVVEHRAAEQDTFGNLRIDEVRETQSTLDETHILVRLRRMEILTVKSSDKELIEEFLKRLRGR